MALDPDLLALMPHSVSVAHRASQDKYGAITYGSGTTWRARIQSKITLVRNSQGLEAVSRTQAYLAGVAHVGIRDRVTLPDGTAPVILAIATFPDEKGDAYEVIYFE